MILKGSQRLNGQNLAAHLMNVADNEHLRVHELRGFASDDLRGAFKEAEAISLGTRRKQYLFSLSLSPPEGATVSAEGFGACAGYRRRMRDVEPSTTLLVRRRTTPETSTEGPA